MADLSLPNVCLFEKHSNRIGGSERLQVGSVAPEGRASSTAALMSLTPPLDFDIVEAMSLREFFLEP